MTWHGRFASYLRARKITRTVAAEELGASVGSVSNWANGVCPPRSEMLFKIQRWSRGRVRAELVTSRAA